MKKFVSSALALTLIASVLAGCSSNTTSTSDPGSAPESSTPSSQVESNTQEEQTNTEKALALIGTFASGDTETARDLLDENYIQHNLAYDAFGNPHFRVDEELRRRLETKLIISILDFDLN